MSQSREEILANFQECTGIDNVEEAIMWLDSAHWDLLAAINNAVPQDAQMRMYDGTDNKNENEGVPVTISSDFIESPSGSKPQRNLELRIHYKGNVYILKVPDIMTVGCVKTLIYAETRLPPCQQEISGWINANAPMAHLSDVSPLRMLELSDVTHLYLDQQRPSSHEGVTEMDVEQVPQVFSNQGKTIDLPEAGDQLSHPSGSRSRSQRHKYRSEGDNSDTLIHLKIHDGNHNKDHSIKVPGNQRVGDVKEDIANLTGIPLPNQTWVGWPDKVSDTTKLSRLHLDQPFHHLTVLDLDEENRKTRNRTRSNLVTYTPSPEPSDSGAETESFEDASESFSVEDEMFTEESSASNRIAPLMPDNVEDETIGSVSFIDGYTLRYGQNSPNFFSGPLENAINEAFLKTGRDKRMLAIYLHHDGSILTNVFCSELLGSESILQLFATYFVIWGWDVTNRRNRDVLMDSVSTHLGQTITHAISTIKLDDFPALLIVSRLRSTVELMNVIRGNIGAQELLNILVSTIDIFSERVEVDIQNEEERAARDRIKLEQDLAYQESLNLDKAKEESRRQQLLLQEQEEKRLKKEEEQRAVEKLSVESRLPEEPSEDPSSKDIFTFRFRTPKGDFFIRRFKNSDKLQTVFDYLLVQGYRVTEFKVISPWPRKDLSALDGTSLLKDVGLCLQETLTLEER